MKIFAVTLLLLGVAAAPVAAGTLAGVTLPDKAEVRSQTLVLNGMGLRKKLFIKVYVGGLYLPHKERVASRILAADESRCMVLQFIYDVSKDQMCDAWKDGLERSTPHASAEVKAAFRTLCSWMDGVGKGQKLTLTYFPGAGTEVELGGAVKGTLPGKPVADAVLATWIGPDPPPGEDFKNAVLGQ